MLGFSPFKRHANKFNYIPRYFDPAKEAREQRRAEMHGQRSEDSEREYSPGQFIRTQREARAARRSQEDDNGRKKIWKMAVGVIFVFLFVYLLYPRLADTFLRAQRGVEPPKVEQVETDFNPAATIVIVPNDYQEQ